MSLTPADVHNVAFSKPPIGKRGYNEDEVDAFLDLVETELARLIEENSDLRQQVEQLDQQLEATRSDLDEARSKPPVQGVVASRQVDEPPRRLAAVHGGGGVGAIDQPVAAAAPAGLAGGDHHVQAAKVLGLAQEMADRLTGEAKTESDSMLSEARAKSEQLLSEARSKSDAMVNEARTRAETMLNEARTRAETVERQAKEKATTLRSDAERQHHELLSKANEEKSALDKKIDTLRTFEREYRTRLKTFLESHLRDLEDRGSAAPAEDRSAAQGYAFGPRAEAG
ncbi:MAG: DivIVA domain-containing protein [Sciscionella sp.]|nr:DivIVA domain-containing protein [Sciscionella sp.]